MCEHVKEVRTFERFVCQHPCIWQPHTSCVLSFDVDMQDTPHQIYNYVHCTVVGGGVSLCVCVGAKEEEALCMCVAKGDVVCGCLAVDLN